MENGDRLLFVTYLQGSTTLTEGTTQKRLRQCHAIAITELAVERGLHRCRCQLVGPNRRAEILSIIGRWRLRGHLCSLGMLVVLATGDLIQQEVALLIQNLPRRVVDCILAGKAVLAERSREKKCMHRCTIHGWNQRFAGPLSGWIRDAP